MAKSPLALMKDKFGEKAKLVAAVQAFADDNALWLGRAQEGKGLAHVSNAKLLRLHGVFTEVKKVFGSREKLIAAILETEKRTKDATLWGESLASIQRKPCSTSSSSCNAG